MTKKETPYFVQAKYKKEEIITFLETIKDRTQTLTLTEINWVIEYWLSICKKGKRGYWKYDKYPIYKQISFMYKDLCGFAESIKNPSIEKTDVGL